MTAGGKTIAHSTKAQKESRSPIHVARTGETVFSISFSDSFSPGGDLTNCKLI